jgi:hypothetical protein
MARKSPGGTLIEAKHNNPGVVLFNGREVMWWFSESVFAQL